MLVQWIMDPLCPLLHRKTSNKRVSSIQSSVAIFKCHRFSLFRLFFSQLSLLIGRFYWLFTAMLSCAFTVLPCALLVPWPCAGFIHLRKSRRPMKSENWDVIRPVRRISLLLRSGVTSHYPVPEYHMELSDPVGFHQQRDASLAFMKCTDVSLFCSFQMPGLSRTGCTQKVSLNTSKFCERMGFSVVFQWQNRRTVLKMWSTKWDIRSLGVLLNADRWDR